MDLLKGKATIVQLQLLVWIAVYFIIFFSLLPEDGFPQAASFTTISVAFYIMVIYLSMVNLKTLHYQVEEGLRLILFKMFLALSNATADKYKYM